MSDEQAMICSMCLGKGAFVLTDNWPIGTQSYGYPVVFKCDCGIPVANPPNAGDFPWYIFLDRSQKPAGQGKSDE